MIIVDDNGKPASHKLGIWLSSFPPFENSHIQKFWDEHPFIEQIAPNRAIYCNPHTFAQFYMVESPELIKFHLPPGSVDAGIQITVTYGSPNYYVEEVFEVVGHLYKGFDIWFYDADDSDWSRKCSTVADALVSWKRQNMLWILKETCRRLIGGETLPPIFKRDHCQKWWRYLHHYNKILSAYAEYYYVLLPILKVDPQTNRVIRIIPWNREMSDAMLPECDYILVEHILNIDPSTGTQNRIQLGLLPFRIFRDLFGSRMVKANYFGVDVWMYEMDQLLKTDEIASLSLEPIERLTKYWTDPGEFIDADVQIVDSICGI